jgi:uncharacterized protein YutE (UPF0331/DUF86 family)
MSFYVIRRSILIKYFAKKFAYSAGFRNVLVHMYDEVDLGILEKFLTEKLRDFEKFTRYVLEYIELATLCWLYGLKSISQLKHSSSDLL